MDKFHEVSQEKASKDLDLMWVIAVATADIVSPLHSGIGWIARQTKGGYGFTIDKGFAYVSDEDLHTVDHDTLAVQCAEQILGYPVDGTKHRADLLAFWRLRLKEQVGERDILIAEVDRIRDIIKGLEG